MMKTDECSFYFCFEQVDCAEETKIDKSSKDELKNLIILLVLLPNEKYINILYGKCQSSDSMRVQLLKYFGLKKKNIYEDHKDYQERREQYNINVELEWSIKSKNKYWSILHKLRILKMFYKMKATKSSINNVLLIP